MTAPLEYMTPDHGPSLRHAMRKVTEEHDQLVRNLMLAEDWIDFKERCGRIRGLSTAIAILRDVEREFGFG